VVPLSRHLLREINEWKFEKKLESTAVFTKEIELGTACLHAQNILYSVAYSVACTSVCSSRYFFFFFYMSRFLSHSCIEILPFWAPGSHLNKPSSTVSLLHHGSIIRGSGISLASDSLICLFRVPYLFEVPVDEPWWLRWFWVHMCISSLSFAESFIWAVTLKTCLLLEHRLNGRNICAFLQCVCALNCNTYREIFFN